MQIDTSVAAADVGVVKIDQNVDFTVNAFPMETFHGKVVQVREIAPIRWKTWFSATTPLSKWQPGVEIESDAFY